MTEYNPNEQIPQEPVVEVPVQEVVPQPEMQPTVDAQAEIPVQPAEQSFQYQAPQQFAPQEPQTFVPQAPQQFAPQEPQTFVPQVPQQFVPQQPQFRPQAPQNVNPYSANRDSFQQSQQAVYGQNQSQAQYGPNGYQQAPYQGYPQYQQPQNSGLDTAALICGIAAAVLGFFGLLALLGIAAGVAAIILAIKAGKQTFNGKMSGMALAGLICGICGIAFGIPTAACALCTCAVAKSGVNDLMGLMEDLY